MAQNDHGIDYNSTPLPEEPTAPRQTKRTKKQAAEGTPVASTSGGGEETVRRSGFSIIKASELIPTNFAPLVSAVDNLFVEGLTLFCGASKIGKSWLMLDLCHSVASGKDFLDRKTTKGEVLYLALEDSARRLKDRLVKLGLSNDAPDSLMFTTQSNNVDNGLLEDIEKWISERENPRLIVIDTLQKIRGKCRPGVNAYEADYEIMGKLKAIADKKHVSIVLVHHLNKMKAKDTSDQFDRISGSTGLMGAADTTILFLKNRSDNTATVAVTGRDVFGDDFVVTMQDGKWTASGETAKQHRDSMIYQNSGIVSVIKELMSQSIGPSFEIATADFKEYGAKKGYLEFALTDKAFMQSVDALAPLLLANDNIGIAPKGKVKGTSRRGLRFFRTEKKA